MPLSPSDTILVTPPVDYFAQTRKYVIARPTPLSAADVDYVLALYRDACTTGGVDPELVLTQMVHETAGMTSDWFVNKRNPAGIGVTGALDASGVPVGQTFLTWLDAVQCHVGLLLCYRFPAGNGNASQKRLIDLCLSYRPNAPRGVGTTVGDMAVKWAADPEYITKLDAMSSAIRKA